MGLAAVRRVAHRPVSAGGSGATLLPLFVPPVALNAFMGWVFAHARRGTRTADRADCTCHGRTRRAVAARCDALRAQVTAAWTALFVVLTIVICSCALRGARRPAGRRRPAAAVHGAARGVVAVRQRAELPVRWCTVRGRVRGASAAFAARLSQLFDFTRRVVRLGALFRPAGSSPPHER